MRDPEGSLRFEGTRAVRQLRMPIEESHFLHAPLAARLVSEERMVAFEIAGATEVVSPLIPFVTFPDEWCDLQAHDAAALTLSIQSDANAAGFDLKDASAWNVLFDGARPLFCDHLSFEPLSSKPWWAAGQYARHFLLPLLLSKRRGLHVAQAFRVWRDGVPPLAARDMLGVARFLTRYWPLMAGAVGHEESGAAARETPVPAHAPVAPSLEGLKTYRRSLHASLDWMLAGLRPRSSATGPWVNYEVERGHYADQAMAAKRALLVDWFGRVKAEWVLDLGCNAGEFSLLARDHGAQVVAIDSDHDAVQTLYGRVRGTAGIHPVLAQIDDLTGGRGWAGSEFQGLPRRLEARFDIVSMLALVHHLMIGASIPIAEVARFAHRCSRGWAIVEMIGRDDVQLRCLCDQRQRDPADFDVSVQRDAFVAAGFTIEAEVNLSGSQRFLALLRKS